MIGDIYVMGRYKFLRNAFVIGGLIVIIYLLYIFFSGSHINNHIQGTWVGVDCSTEYVFAGTRYAVNGIDMGTFAVNGNTVQFCNGIIYTISVRRSYMVLNGIHYLRMD